MIPVLFIKVPQVLRGVPERKAYADWLTGALKGTVLEGCRVVLLDGGTDIELHASPPPTTEPKETLS